MSGTRWIVAALLMAGPLAAGGCSAKPATNPVATNTPAGRATATVAEPPAEPPAEPAELPDDGTMLQPWVGDLDGMVERRYVRMLVTFNRTNYFLDKAEQRGVTYEAGKQFETFLNQRLGTKTVKVHVAFIPVRHDQLFQALVDGRGDIAASNLTITEERQTLATFARPWLTDVRELVVLAPGQPAVDTVEGLSGRDVHVRRSSAYFDSLQALNARLTAAGKAPVHVVEADEQLEDDDILEMVNTGLMPATVVDSHIADIWSKVFDRLQVQRTAVLRTDGEIAWALRPGSTKLLEAVNAFAAVNAKGTAAFNMLYRKYFQDTRFIRNARSEADLARFVETIALFKRYGDQYEFPWLLIAAQAYQESGIDQSRRSSAGAVGVMQIKPSTAEGPPVFISGVDESAERNINAGVKYLRFIADQLDDEPALGRVDRALFAFASYNAGPARVAGLRRKAAQRGLDPNKWFGNVEIVAAREIGQETVQYVGNIYKYYTSYTLIQRELAERDRVRTAR